MKILSGSVISVCFLISLSIAGHAAPPPGADTTSPEAKWVQSLRMNGSGVSCCDIADCRKVEYRTSSNQVEAFIKGSWVPIPDSKILLRENPTGSAWACYDQEREHITQNDIYCFVLLDLI